MKFLRLFSLLAVLLALAVAVFAASAEVRDAELDTELADAEIDEELTAKFNAGGEIEDEVEVGAEERERRGGYYHQKPVYPVKPMPPPPAPVCCYWQGYQYKPGTWNGYCYCGTNGQWQCVKPKPQPPKPSVCVYNKQWYYHGSCVYFSKEYFCYCVNGQWGNCQYIKPVYKPQYHKNGHKKW